MMKTPWRLTVLLALIAVGARAGEPTQGGKGKTDVATSEARAFPYDQGVVDLLVIGPAAKTLYDRLPGRGEKQACGAQGLHKGDGKMTCAKDGSDYSCHIWLDALRQTLAEPETDDC